jgi:hypothetical protein
MSSSEASEWADIVVKSTLPDDNKYVRRIVEKYLSNSVDKKISQKFRHIDDELLKKIENNKKSDIENSFNYSEFIINVILREKLADRSALIDTRRQKFILTILTITLPLITNLFQFLITHYS